MPNFGLDVGEVFDRIEMTPEDKKYLAYLTYWMTDRIITAVYQGQTETRILDAQMPEVREEAEELYQNFYTPKEKQ